MSSITLLYAKSIIIVAYLAKKTNVMTNVWTWILHTMVSGARYFKPLARSEANLGVPFIGNAKCFDMACRAQWTLFCPDGIHPDCELECPVCNKDSGGLL